MTSENGGAVWLAIATLVACACELLAVDSLKAYRNCLVFTRLNQHILPHYHNNNLINQSNSNECNMSLWSVYTIQCDNSIVVGCVAVHYQTSLSNGTHSRWPG